MFRPEALATMKRKRPNFAQIEEFSRSPKAFLAHLDACGVDRAVLINYVAPEIIGFTPEVNDWIARYVQADPKRLLSCGSIHPKHTPNVLADMEQLVPALGLRKMYGAGYRRFPLYIDAPLFEAATFRVRLPAHTVVAHRPADLRLQTEFGQYAVTFHRLADGRWQIRRAFRVPVQVVPADRFSAFSRFALRIEDAERQRLTLESDQSLRGAAQP